MKTQIFVKQKFNVRKRRGDRDGFAIRADSYADAIKELQEWYAACVRIAGSSSFDGALVYDREAFNADPLHTKPLHLLTSVSGDPREPSSLIFHKSAA